MFYKLWYAQFQSSKKNKSKKKSINNKTPHANITLLLPSKGRSPPSQICFPDPWCNTWWVKHIPLLHSLKAPKKTDTAEDLLGLLQSQRPHYQHLELQHRAIQPLLGDKGLGPAPLSITVLVAEGSSSSGTGKQNGEGRPEAKFSPS